MTRLAHRQLKLVAAQIGEQVDILARGREREILSIMRLEKLIIEQDLSVAVEFIKRVVMTGRPERTPV